jgi:hypothetical protein
MLTPASDDRSDAKMDELAQWIRGAKSVAWFTGAGISTESGLPDCRGPNGVWTQKKKGLPRRSLKRTQHITFRLMGPTVTTATVTMSELHRHETKLRTEGLASRCVLSVDGTYLIASSLSQ